MVNIIDWDDFLRPKGYYCFSDYLLHLEGKDGMINVMSSSLFYKLGQSLEKLSENGYITNCSHPSQKGHEEIAKVLYEHIKETKNKPNKKII